MNKSLRRRHVFKVDNAYQSVKETISELFFKFGCLVGRHPIICSLVPLFTSIALGFGLFTLKQNNNTEKLFTPVDSQIYTDRARIKDLFPDSTDYNFDAFGLLDIPASAVMLFRQGGEDTRTETELFPADIDGNQLQNNIFDPGPMRQIQSIVDKAKAIVTEHEGVNYTMQDLCAVSLTQCAKDGEQYATDDFLSELRAGNVSYPYYKDKMGFHDVRFNIAGVKLNNHKMIEAARALKIRFFFRVDRMPVAKKWCGAFLQMIQSLEENLTGGLDMAYSTSVSLEEELLKGTSGDIIYFSLTIALMVIYSIFVSTGGDIVSTRALLACGGVLAAGLGIVSALGLLCLLGADYVNFVGIMPYLVLGIGVDDMFLLMSAWGESIQYDVSVPERVGLTFSKAGVGITITTLTDFLAFLIGTYSKFIAVRQFCLYTALAVLLCYVCNCTLFGACMSLHGDRVYASKHCITCRQTKSRKQLREEGANTCKVYACGGSVPKEVFEDESLCEQLPRFILPRIVLNPVVKVFLLIAFLGYLGAAVYGAIQLKPGMKYVDLVLRSSYYYKFSSWDTDYFGQRLATSFVVDKEINYAGKDGDTFRLLLNQAQRDPMIDTNFLRCWLHTFSRSALYPSKKEAQDPEVFGRKLREYLKHDKLSQNDVIFFNDTSARIRASRCYVLTVDDVSIFRQSELMIRMRDLVETSKEYPVIVFQPLYVMLEHTIAILPSTLQTIGTAVAVMFVVTLMMLPQLLMVSLVTLNIVFIITCVFGSMHYLGITFSGISMIHVLMSVGFSVDFSAHICSAYLMCDSVTRLERARYALVHASGPIFNGGMSSLVGVSILLLSESYFFRTFFKVMSMVILAGAVNSVLFMPIILSYIGPENPETIVLPSGARRWSTAIRKRKSTVSPLENCYRTSSPVKAATMSSVPEEMAVSSERLPSLAVLGEESVSPEESSVQRHNQRQEKFVSYADLNHSGSNNRSLPSIFIDDLAIELLRQGFRVQCDQLCDLPASLNIFGVSIEFDSYQLSMRDHENTNQQPSSPSLTTTFDYIWPLSATHDRFHLSTAHCDCFPGGHSLGLQQSSLLFSHDASSAKSVHSTMTWPSAAGRVYNYNHVSVIDILPGTSKIALTQRNNGGRSIRVKSFEVREQADERSWAKDASKCHRRIGISLKTFCVPPSAPLHGTFRPNFRKTSLLCISFDATVAKDYTIGCNFSEPRGRHSRLPQGKSRMVMPFRGRNTGTLPEYETRNLKTSNLHGSQAGFGKTLPGYTSELGDGNQNTCETQFHLTDKKQVGIPDTLPKHISEVADDNQLKCETRFNLTADNETRIIAGVKKE